MRAPSSPSSDWPAGASAGPAGSLLAATALTGIALVSLIGLFTGGASRPAPLVVPPSLTGAVVLVAPGLEAVLLSFPDPEQVRLHPPWERLPVIDRSYTVVLPEEAELPRLPLGWEPESETLLGEWRWVTVATAESVGEADRYDFAEHISEAEVYFDDPNGARVPCDRWRFGRWSCGLDEWLWVGPTEQMFRGRPEACLWAHPWAGHDLVVRFPHVPRGTRLMGRYGLTDTAVAAPGGAAVSLIVRADGTERSFLAENREGMQTYQLRLDSSGTQPLDVELVVRADADGRRHFCFSGAMQGIGAAPVEGERDEGRRNGGQPAPDLTRVEEGSGDGGSSGSGQGVFPRLRR